MEVKPIGVRLSHGVATEPPNPYPDGGASPRSRATAASQEALPGRDRPRNGRQSGVGDALEAAARARGPARPPAPPAARAAVPADARPVAPAPPPAPARGHRRWVR